MGEDGFSKKTYWRQLETVCSSVARYTIRTYDPRHVHCETTGRGGVTLSLEGRVGEARAGKYDGRRFRQREGRLGCR